MAVKRKVVIVGLGSIGNRHARLLKERSDISLEIVEPNERAIIKAKEKFGDFHQHASFDRMLTTAPDIVLIATPHRLHAEQTIEALHAGSDVFCEKPMSDSLEDAVKMKEACDQADKLLNIGFHMHFHPALKTLKGVIESHRLGNIVYAHARVGTYITLVNSVSHYQQEQEGALLLDYAHQPDMLYWLLRKVPRYVYASGVQAGNLELSSNPNIADIHCEYDDDLIASIHLNYVQMPQRQSYEIVGDQGWAFLDLEQNELRIGKRQDSTVETKTFTVERDDLYRAEHQAFMDALDGKRPPETSALDGLVSTAVCHATVASWKTRQRVAIELPACVRRNR
jgi:predicted dehydrogenase